MITNFNKYNNLKEGFINKKYDKKDNKKDNFITNKNKHNIIDLVRNIYNIYFIKIL